MASRIYTVIVSLVDLAGRFPAKSKTFTINKEACCTSSTTTTTPEPYYCVRSTITGYYCVELADGYYCVEQI